MFKSSKQHICHSMILSKNEIKVLSNKEDVDYKERWTLIKRARNKIDSLNSIQVKKELSVIAKNMDSQNLLEIIDLLVDKLPLPLAKDYFIERNKHINKSILGAFEYNNKLKNITEEVKRIAKELKTKKILNFGEVSAILYIDNKSVRIKEIKKIYLENLNFVLSRKMPLDQKFIGSNNIRKIVFENAQRLKHFTLEKLIAETIIDIKKIENRSEIKGKHGESTLKELINIFLQLGIIQKVDASEEEFIKIVRKKILSGEYKTIDSKDFGIRRLIKKIQIYPYANRLNNKEELKINPYYLTL